MSKAIMTMVMAVSMMVTQPVTDLAPLEVEYVQTAKCYDEESLYWLSRVIYAEAGSNSDLLQKAVGSVVLNRCDSSLYPDTIKEVIFDTKHGLQYGCVRNKMIYRTPDDRAIENAKWLLENGSIFPLAVLAQCDHEVWGGKYKVIEGVVFSMYNGKVK